MTLTYEDRTRWMQRLEDRLDRACHDLCRHDETLKRMKRDAKHAAAEELGIRSLLDERDRVLNEGEQLRRKEQRLRQRMLAAVLGEPPEEVSVGSHPSLPMEVEDAISIQSRRKLRAMLTESEVGQTLLALRQERREIEDTVMLASSEAELQSVWAGILSRVGKSLPEDIDVTTQRHDPTVFEG